MIFFTHSTETRPQTASGAIPSIFLKFRLHPAEIDPSTVAALKTSTVAGLF
jgi:hypothetical protein